jgi:DNA-binding transcriptional ArsR family regulator
MPQATPPTELDAPAGATIPPDFVLVPAPVAYAAVPGDLALTMVRIVGPCWRQDYEQSPVLTAGELARLVGRPRSTLDRHLKQLEIELGWLRIRRMGRRVQDIGIPRRPHRVEFRQRQWLPGQCLLARPGAGTPQVAYSGTTLYGEEMRRCPPRKIPADGVQSTSPVRGLGFRRRSPGRDRATCPARIFSPVPTASCFPDNHPKELLIPYG